MALREINLIPPETVIRRYVRRHLCFWGLCFGFLVTAIFGFHVYQLRFSLARPVLALEDTTRKLASRLAEVDRIKKELEVLNQRQGELENERGGAACSLVILKLSGLMNQHTWLSALEIVRGTHDDHHVNELKLVGFSFGNESLGEFLDQLSDESLFKDISLKYAREAFINEPGLVKNGKTKLIHFQIDCII